MTLLNDDEWVKWSDREIARRAGVNETLVRRLRAEVDTAFKTQYEAREYIHPKTGNITTMSTANIGKSNDQPSLKTSRIIWVENMRD